MDILISIVESIGKEATVALATTMALALFKLVKVAWSKVKEAKEYFNAKKLKKVTRDIKDGLSSYVLTVEDLKELCLETGAIRATVVQLHNGGHLPKLGSALKATIVSEWAMAEQELIAAKWQGALVDSDYILSVIKPILNSDTYYLKTSDLRGGSRLRDHYTANGIVGSKLTMIGISKESESTFLISCHFQEEPNIDEALRAINREKGRVIASKLGLI